MGLFDMLSSVSTLVESPEITKAVEGLAGTLAAIPRQLAAIELRLASGNDLTVETNRLLEKMNDSLMRLEHAVGGVVDPIPRPPFGVSDVEAIMGGEWPPKTEDETHGE